MQNSTKIQWIAHDADNDNAIINGLKHTSVFFIDQV